MMKNRKMMAVMLTAWVMTMIIGCTSKDIHKEAEAVKVETMVVRAREVASMQRYSATIDAEESSTLSFASIGSVSNVYVKEGQYVKKGTLLAELDGEAARSTYEAVKSMLLQAEDTYQRSQPLYEKGVIAKIKWVEIETKRQQAVSVEAIAKKGLDDMKLYSPCAGYVSDLSISVGQQTAVGIPVMKIVNTENLKVEFAVPEREIGLFCEGMTLHISVSAIGVEVSEAVVSEVSMVADRLSRTYKVCAKMKNIEGKLRVGMLCEVWRMTDDEKVMAIPTMTIQLDADGSQYVWIVEDGKACKKKITTGAYIGDDVAVEGLTEGQHLIVKGQQKVSNGMCVIEQ